MQGKGTIILLDLNDIVNLLVEMIPGVRKVAACTLVDVATGAAAPRAIANAMATDEAAESLRAGAAAGKEGPALGGAGGGSGAVAVGSFATGSGDGGVVKLLSEFLEEQRKANAMQHTMSQQVLVMGNHIKIVDNKLHEHAREMQELRRDNEQERERIQEQLQREREEERKRTAKMIENSIKKRLQTTLPQQPAGGAAKRAKVTSLQKFDVSNPQHKAAFLDRVVVDTRTGEELALPADIMSVMFTLEFVQMTVADVRLAMADYYAHTKMHNRFVPALDKRKNCYPGFRVSATAAERRLLGSA